MIHRKPAKQYWDQNNSMFSETKQILIIFDWKTYKHLEPCLVNNINQQQNKISQFVHLLPGAWDHSCLLCPFSIPPPRLSHASSFHKIKDRLKLALAECYSGKKMRCLYAKPTTSTQPGSASTLTAEQMHIGQRNMKILRFSNSAHNMKPWLWSENEHQSWSHTR